MGITSQSKLKYNTYLASMALTRTCRHRTVILTSAPNAANLERKRLANLQNKLKQQHICYYYQVFIVHTYTRDHTNMHIETGMSG